MDSATELILSGEAREFISELHRRFEHTRQSLLNDRDLRQADIDAGRRPDFLVETADIRAGDWRVAPLPDDLADRKVEITGPVDRKMIINALNSGARVFMADFEDASSPTWRNMIEGQANLYDAIRRQVDFTTPEGKSYELHDEVATLMVRPRGWHLVEKHIEIDGQPVAASLVDFGLFFFHNAAELIERGSGPYFYLPKLESHLEARLWNDVFVFAQERLGVPRSSIRATVLIETISAAFEMDEILYELRDHSAGLNAGRWDYIFSMIKRFRNRPGFVLPDRSDVTMSVPFMEAYTRLLIQTCHRRGAHAMGGMSAFIPSRRDEEINRLAIAQVRQDKEYEATRGHDGTWVAHPDLVPVAMEIFDRVLGDAPNQIDRDLNLDPVSAQDLTNVAIADGQITDGGLRTNVSVGIRYLASWLSGNGAAAIFNLMEDAATAEISRSQIWQWVHNEAKQSDGTPITAEYIRRLTNEVMAEIKAELGESTFKEMRFEEARELFETVALDPDFEEFLTIPAYKEID